MRECVGSESSLAHVSEGAISDIAALIICSLKDGEHQGVFSDILIGIQQF